MNILILQGSPRANGNTAWMAEEYKKAPIQRMYCVNSPAKVKKMALVQKL